MKWPRGTWFIAASVATCASASLCGCEWIFGLNVRSEAPDATFDDGGVEASVDAAPTDALVDVNLEAGVDALYCSTIGVDASFCWSFDEPPYFPPASSKLQIVSNSDALQLLSGPSARTPPNSLVLVVNSNEAQPSGIFHAQAKQSPHVTCHFDVRVAQMGENPIYISELDSPGFDGGAAPITARISLVPLPVSSFNVNLEVTQAGGTPGTSGLGGNAIDVWFSVMVDVDVLDALQVSATVSEIDGTATQQLDASTPGLISSFYIGAAPVSGTPGAWRLNFDDLYCTGF